MDFRNLRETPCTGGREYATISRTKDAAPAFGRRVYSGLLRFPSAGRIYNCGRKPKWGSEEIGNPVPGDADGLFHHGRDCRRLWRGHGHSCMVCSEESTQPMYGPPYPACGRQAALQYIVTDFDLNRHWAYTCISPLSLHFGGFVN